MIALKGIHPNLDFPAGPTYHMMGFDIPMFPPIFVMSRITGLDGPRHRAGRGELPDPAAQPVRRTGAAAGPGLSLVR